MNDINFLPATYVQKRARHFRVYREMIWLAAMAVVIGVWQLATRNSLNDVETMARQLESQATLTHDQKTETLKLHAKQQELLDSVKLERELALPVSLSAVMGKLSELMPPSMAMTSLDITDPRPEPTPKVEGDDSTPAPRAKSPHPLLRVEIVGLAAADVDVADFVGRLSSCRLFNNVKMPFSRATQAGNLQAREFRIEMEVPLDREYLPATVEAKTAKNDERGEKSETVKTAERPSLVTPRSSTPKEVANAD